MSPRPPQASNGVVLFLAVWCSIPDGGLPTGAPAHLVFQLMATEELVEVTILHVLCDHAQRVVFHAHTQQPYNVEVLQARHDLHLLQEVVSLWAGEGT